MGEIAEMLLNGDCCEGCGEYLGSGDGFARKCPACSGGSDVPGRWSHQRKKKKVAYVVFIGRTLGLYESWAECEAQVKGYQGARFKGYYTHEEAIAAWERFENGGKMDVREQRKVGSHGRSFTPKKPNPAIRDYARHLVKKYSGPDGTGSHTNS